MRELARIERIMSLIKDIWILFPDTRFNQLMYNLQYDFSRKNDNKYTQYSYSMLENSKGIAFQKDVSNVNLFQVEDDKFEEFLTEYLFDVNVMKERK